MVQPGFMTSDIAVLQAELETGLRLEELLAELALAFTNRPAAGDLGEDIERAQRRLCEVLDLDRSTIWHFAPRGGGVLRLRRLVQLDDAPMPASQLDAAVQFPYIISRMRLGQPFFLASLADLPAEGERDRQTLAAYGTKSAAIFPLQARGTVFAALTFATMRAEREWPSALTRRLALVSQVFANALARSDADVALREVTGRLINAQEKERARLAQELHDGMSQQLAVLAVELQLLGLRPPANSTDLRARLDELSDKTKALSSDVHRMSHALHPAKLERLGLVAAIGGFCRELDAARTVCTRFQAEAIPADIPRDRALALYRVTQEALWNVLRHSGASDALVTLRGNDTELVLCVADDGCGFDPASVSAGGSLGLLGMRERIGVFGGQIEWHTAPGRGTEVRAQMPLPVRTTS